MAGLNWKGDFALGLEASAVRRTFVGIGIRHFEVEAGSDALAEFHRDILGGIARYSHVHGFGEDEFRDVVFCQEGLVGGGDSRDG